ncbi:Hypothetical protein NTJ_14995 [Nesidiocoris tenuis]|uniref:Uncharacterized protein n=1 Tax=Nesidiocoris tenuis TaxID=355587 RepID=A0ABN7BCT9_9HEMI|nr:Hypothetical protein NTJ_14995 [Nesidiocoris tenuis]
MTNSSSSVQVFEKSPSPGAKGRGRKSNRRGMTSPPRDSCRQAALNTQFGSVYYQNGFCQPLASSPVSATVQGVSVSRRYAGFTEPPSPATLPAPPVHWTRANTVQSIAVA